MKIIKMVKGSTVINGKQYAVGDSPFEVEDEAKAARLVKLGVAEYAYGAKVVTSSNANSDDGNDENNETDIDSMSYSELKEKATELGINYPGKKKEVLIEEIKAALADNDNSDAPTFDPVGNVQ